MVFWLKLLLNTKKMDEDSYFMICLRYYIIIHFWSSFGFWIKESNSPSGHSLTTTGLASHSHGCEHMRCGHKVGSLTLAAWMLNDADANQSGPARTVN